MVDEGDLLAEEGPGTLYLCATDCGGMQREAEYLEINVSQAQPFQPYKLHTASSEVLFPKLGAQ